MLKFLRTRLNEQLNWIESFYNLESAHYCTQGDGWVEYDFGENGEWVHSYTIQFVKGKEATHITLRTSYDHENWFEKRPVEEDEFYDGFYESEISNSSLKLIFF